MRFGVLQFPGSCDERDAVLACERVDGASAELLWHRDPDLRGVDAIVVPGGFSYGDYLRVGAIARFSPAMESVIAFADDGGPVLGICNGFQVLCEAGLLPGALLPNDGLRFVCRQVDLEVSDRNTIFTRDCPDGTLSIPVKHTTGRFYAPDPAAVNVVLRYAPGQNPNGSLDDIAGVTNDAGNVMGLMPHPEHAVDALTGSTDGLSLFSSLALDARALSHAPIAAVTSPQRWSSGSSGRWRYGGTDEPVELPGARQRALLAVLLLRAGEVVPADRLLDDVWGDEPPRAGSTALRVRVSQLRKAMGPDGSLIVTRAPGYLIAIDATQLDMRRFERLTQEGDQALTRGEPEAAVDLLGAALALWRGAPLADFPYEPFAQGPIQRLEELRMAAREQLIAAELTLGRHGRLLGDLRELVAEYPLRERLWAHLILALYRDGRQAEALECYRTARRTLSEEIGIEPGAELRALEAQILNQDPALDGAVRIARPARAVLAVTTAAPALVPLAAVGVTFAREGDAELVIGALVPDEQALAGATAALNALREDAVEVRVAAFTSDDVGRDTTRLASEHDVALLLLDAPAGGDGGFEASLATVLRDVAADVVILVGGERSGAAADGPVVVPFAGHDHDWAALETGAWLARGRGVTLRLVGTRATPGAGRRDASRLLASASLALQRGARVSSESVLADPGAAGVIAAGADAGFIVASISSRWPKEGLGRERAELARGAHCPVLFVRRGVSPSGLAPPEALTRFTWSRIGG